MHQKQAEVEERRKMEESLRVAHEKEAQDQIQRRQHLKELTEQDRKAKLLQKISATSDQYSLGGKDNISKLFDRPTHQAYDRRAK